MLKRPLAALAALTAAALALSACSGSGSGSASDDQKSIAIFTTAYGLPAPKYTLDTITQKAKDAGWDVTMYSTDDDFDKLNSDMQSASLQNYDAFVLGYPDPRAMTVGLTAAKDAGVPVFAIDGDVEANDMFAQDVAVDQTSIADISVGALEDAMGGVAGKTVMVVTFDPSLTISTPAGLAEQALQDAGATVVVRPIQNGASAQPESLAFVTDYLQANPDGLDGVWTGLDPAALGAAQAVSEAGADVPVTGVDAMGAAVAQIAADTPLVATVFQDWQTIADTTFQSLSDWVENGTAPTENFVQIPGQLVDRQNAADFTPLY